MYIYICVYSNLLYISIDLQIRKFIYIYIFVVAEVFHTEDESRVRPKPMPSRPKIASSGEGGEDETWGAWTDAGKDAHVADAHVAPHPPPPRQRKCRWCKHYTYLGASVPQLMFIIYIYNI